MIYKIIQKRKIFLTLSSLVITASLVALFSWGLNFGLDFTGGSLLEVKFDNYQPSVTEVQSSVQGLNLQSLVIQPTEDSVILRFKDDSEDVRQSVLASLQVLAEQKETTVSQLQFDSIGASIGQELKSKSFNAAIIVFLMIILYISWAFKSVSKPVASWKYGVTAIIALMHDLILILGIFSVLGHFYGTEINTPFIAAVLTILGYSVSDTIVIFDRIRENLPKSNEDFENTVNRSLNQTLIRSFNTSFSSILALLAVIFLGGSTIKDFAIALAIGIGVGTYSSIFIASPVLVIWNNLAHRRQKNKA